MMHFKSSSFTQYTFRKLQCYISIIFPKALVEGTDCLGPSDIIKISTLLRGETVLRTRPVIPVAFEKGQGEGEQRF